MGTSGQKQLTGTWSFKRLKGSPSAKGTKIGILGACPGGHCHEMKRRPSLQTYVPDGHEHIQSSSPNQFDFVSLQTLQSQAYVKNGDFK